MTWIQSRSNQPTEYSSAPSGLIPQVIFRCHSLAKIFAPNSSSSPKLPPPSLPPESLPPWQPLIKPNILMSFWFKATTWLRHHNGTKDQPKHALISNYHPPGNTDCQANPPTKRSNKFWKRHCDCFLLKLHFFSLHCIQSLFACWQHCWLVCLPDAAPEGARALVCVY